ncbi:MAG: hypothetical protein ACO4AI_14120 [Prochlorothrix sp.]
MPSDSLKGTRLARMPIRQREEFNAAYRAWEQRRYGRVVERDMRVRTTQDIRLQNAKKEASR